MSLPLFTTQATHSGLPLVHIASHDDVDVRSTTCGVDPHGRMPDRRPGPGEQYRFHVDMESCIGCKCCVVACNEQNGNPATINWRRVAEVEGGSFPDTRRAWFSMGCNHCADPTCLAGCPVDAYSKDEQTGIVRHSAETCIGCQYSTWTCSYGVPQFNPERGVVGKCDMCYGRLSLGQAPACVSACPEGALAIEIVNVAEWRAEVARLDAGTGVPVADASVSTTRVTMPTASLPVSTRPVDLERLQLDHAHAPLVVMTVLTQLGAGAFVAIWLASLLGGVSNAALAALAALGVTAAALGLAPLHLGRPIHAYRAMKMWRRSWLSREVVLFGAFVHVAAGYTAVLWFGLPGGTAVGALTALTAMAAAVATSCIYLVASRPSWNTPLTVAQFLLTGALLGPLAAAVAAGGGPAWWRWASAIAALALGTIAVLARQRFTASPVVELRGTARLLSTVLAGWFALRLGLLGLIAVALPLSSGHMVILGMALALATGAELIGRYLFFVSAVPRHLTAPYLAVESEAA